MRAYVSCLNNADDFKMYANANLTSCKFFVCSVCCMPIWGGGGKSRFVVVSI